MRSLDPIIKSLLVQAGFSYVAKPKQIKIDDTLVTALVERANILGLICGVLMPDKSRNKVHIMYLPLLANLDRDDRYNWGSTCLAHLYREICRAIYPTSKNMGGYIVLLQSWARYRMPFTQPRVKNQTSYPLATRWSGRGLRFSRISHSNVTGYRSRFDNMHNEEVNHLIFVLFIQTSITLVMLQFGLCQDIPNPPHNLDKIHHTDMRGHIDTNWAEEHQQWIVIWKERCKYVLIGQPILGNIEHMSHYINWYQANSKIFLTQFATHQTLPPHLAQLQTWKLNNILHNKAHQLLPVCMMKDYNHMLNHMNSRYNLIIIKKIMGTIRSSSVLERRLYEQPHRYRSSNTGVFLYVHEKYAIPLFASLNQSIVGSSSIMTLSRKKHGQVRRYTKGLVELNATFGYSLNEIFVLLHNPRKPRTLDA
ncbi:Serine/threonine-protein phosphatase 7 long form [Glycine soja]